ncbi:MAG: FAD-binding oxidoreductase [Rhodobacteraceae bacterium]|nr:FAD-binding oxidoreductase [Paracoccaceae bacterium]
MRYPDTWYSRTLAERRQRPALAGRLSVDCAVVGGGFAGLFTALGLVRGGMRVAVLEAESVGFGASGRNGGFVSDGFAAGAASIWRQAGAARAVALQALSAEGVEILRSLIRDRAIPGALPVDGILRLRRFDRGDDLRAEAGPDVTYLDRAAIGARVASSRYHHGLEERSAFHVHPLNVLRGLAEAVEAQGGLIFERSRVTACDLSGPVKRLVVGAGQVEAAQVVVATGGYTEALVPKLRRSMLPIATYVMLTESAPDLLSGAIRTPMAIGDDRRAGDYYRLLDDGRRLLWGGRITTRAAGTAGIVRQLRAEMLGVYPQLAGLRTELAWSGLMSYAPHRMPMIGQMAPGVWHAFGFGGHGLNTTAIGGTVLAEAMLGRPARLAPFAPFGLRWAGGPLGLAAAQGTYWALQAMDRWRERR